MTVWIVTASYQHEGWEVMDVFSTKALAEVYVTNYAHKDEYDYWTVRRHEVKEAGGRKMNYRKEVLRTAEEPNLAHGAMGLAGEMGEVVDLLKKHLFYGKPLDRDAVIRELGDVRWYLEYLCAAIGVSMEEVEATNVAKLNARFPDGYSDDAAIKRKDV